MTSMSPCTRRDSQQDNNQLRCRVCGRMFARNEHLKRHELIHSDNKPFRCTSCGRSFTRKDALDRHLTIHQAPTRSLRQTGARACLSCAASKLKCSGDIPACSRCQKRGDAPCVYPNMLLPSIHTDEMVLESSPMVQSSDANMDVTTGQQMSVSSHEASIITNSRVFPDTTSLIPLEPGGLDQDYWHPDFQSTINWLPDEFSYLSNDFDLGNLDDVALFPIFNLPQDHVQNESTSGQQQSLLSPIALSHEQRSVTDSPHYSSHDALSPAITSRSVNSTLIPQRHTEGELYVDGQPARLPRVKRRRLTASTLVSTPSKMDTYELKFDSTLIEESDLSGNTYFSDRAYEDLRRAFNLICAQSSDETLSQNLTSSTQHPLRVSFPTRFEGELPPKGIFEMLISSYKSSFHFVLPIIHTSSLSTISWQLVLATSAIGARFVEPFRANPTFAASLQELVRRVLYIGREDESTLPRTAMERAQLRLLHAVNSMYASPSQDCASSDLTIDLPTDFVTHWNHNCNKSEHQQNGTERDWDQWKVVEAKNRLAHGVWLVDCMLAVHSQRKPILSLDDISCNLPCHEDVWQAESVEEWQEARFKKHDATPLKDALYQIYVQKKLSPHMGEFSRVLLIHGLFHRMWDVAKYYRQPLSHWTPTAHRPTEGDLKPDEPLWLPSLPAYARWRNATCDCTDVLHWSANATIGAASGMEHPTVLHLHFSRVVLLTPYENIVAIAKYLVGKDTARLTPSVASNRQTVRRWAVQDQYKARLAMIHAGVLLWHVRRYSANGYYEPSSVAIATLALWAFSMFSEKPQTPTHGRTNDPVQAASQEGSDAEEARCDIILLDRPTDDELVQQYVKEGHRMTAILKGVGDLCSNNGPERVLIEGRKLLRTLTLWGISEYWIGIFDKLIAVSRRPREDGSNEKR